MFKKGFMLLLCLILTSQLSVVGCGSNESSQPEVNLEEVASYSDQEVVEYLQGQGFVFEIDEHTSTFTTTYVYVSNQNSGIVFQKVTNPILGVHYTWKNRDINDEWADIRSSYDNDSAEEQKQFSEFEKWIQSEGLSIQQLTGALDYYEAME